MLNSLMVTVQFMIMLIELKKVLSQEIKCLCNKNITILLERTVPKSMDVSYTFIALEIQGGPKEGKQ